MTIPQANLHFDGTHTYIEIPSSSAVSLATTGALTVSAWIRPAALVFPSVEGLPNSRYVHWLGKGAVGQQEWTFRMYSHDTPDGRANRISFYVFNPQGNLGVGSHFQDTLQAGAWIHVVGAADGQRTFIYRDGIPRDSDQYAGTITPQPGAAPLRVGTRDLHSFFQGAIREVRLWNRRLSDAEVAALHNPGTVPHQGLVAEYLLTHDVAADSAHNHTGIINAPTWLPATS